MQPLLGRDMKGLRMACMPSDFSIAAILGQILVAICRGSLTVHVCMSIRFWRVNTYSPVISRVFPVTSPRMRPGEGLVLPACDATYDIVQARMWCGGWPGDGEA